MVKFLSGNDGKLIFNYLNKDCSALLSAVTEYYPNCFLEDGVFAMQYEENTPASLICHGNSFSLVFTSDKSDFDEILFTVGSEFHSPSVLPFQMVDEYYLLKKSTVPVQKSAYENECRYDDFKAVLNINGTNETVNLQYLFKKGKIKSSVFTENGENTGGGIIINSENYAVISHVFVKENLRGKGVGTRTVNNLLTPSKAEKVYLISEKNNLDFYGKLGFAPVLTVYKYNSENEEVIKCRNFLK